MATSYSSLIKPIQEAIPKLGAFNVMLGFDGTVDVICKPVESREHSGEEFTAFGKMRDFGNRVVEADGKSAMIEIVKQREKIGGNGPIMARALAQSNVAVDYIGPLGQPTLHPVYEEFARRIKVHSIAQPAVTHALEFPNGKLMLASISSYEDVTADRLDAQIGKETMAALIEKSQLCCLLNWTCLPGMNSILRWHLETLLPTLGKSNERTFFFDLTDPSMRSGEDLLEVLDLIGQFETFGRVTLGMNLNEAQLVSRALGLPESGPEKKSLQQAQVAIREKLGIHTAMAHHTDFAACSTPEGSWAVDGPHTEFPVITTGAGDHLNAGFCLAQLLKFSPEDSLKLSVLFSGYYVRTALSPNLEDILEFIPDLESSSTK
ncbi:sugar kinase [Coraliomargarita sinensis]|uniref:Sugar kinase n=1 Tax=Coraliomargarita sinensis TaxID=2174842 RepID=A0A317ZMD0_9BACT|nr:carbohydrate kinase family protein [Coraliomargarita sinensis]PXA04551.1 sugar kinase [Coraliomargarita sinensis]